MSDSIWNEDSKFGLFLGIVMMGGFMLILWIVVDSYNSAHYKELKQYCNNKFYYYDGHMNDCIYNGYPMENTTK